MFTIFYILNNRMDMMRCSQEQLPIMVETLIAQGSKIVKIANERGERIYVKLNCNKKRR